MKLFWRFAKLSFWNKLGAFGAVASILFGLVSIMLYFLPIGDQVDVRYAVDAHDFIAQKNKELPQLRLAWEGVELPNLYTARVAIWNGGRRYVDATSISTSDPIRIAYPVGIKVLSAQFVETAPGVLALKARPGTHKGDDVIFVEIIGNNALERYEGGILRFVYTKQTELGEFGHVRGTFLPEGRVDPAVDFSVIGRIKGCASGFQRVSWADAVRGSMSRLTRWFFLVVGVAFLVFCFSPFILAGSGYVAKSADCPLPLWERCFILLLSLTLLIYMIYVCYNSLFKAGPTWIR